MNVDSTSLLVALRQKPHPSDVGSAAVVDAAQEERKDEEKGTSKQMKTRFRSWALVGATLLAFCGGAASGGVKVAHTLRGLSPQN